MNFDRNCYAVITPGPQYPGGEAAFGPNIKIAGLRTIFRVEKTQASGSNSASVKIYNAAPQTRVKLEKYGAALILFAGYGDNSELLFRGDIIRASTDREGPDVIIALDCVDGFWSTKMAILNISLSPGEDVSVLLDKVVDALKLPVKVKSGVSLRRFATGYTFSGLASEALTEICQNNNPTLSWSIQDGNLHIRPEREPLNLPPLELSNQNGLIGYPAKTKSGITAMSLLNPKLAAGRALTVRSDRFVGVVSALEVNASDKWKETTSGPAITTTIQRLQHRGDTHGQEWNTDIEGIVL